MRRRCGGRRVARAGRMQAGQCTKMPRRGVSTTGQAHAQRMPVGGAQRVMAARGWAHHDALVGLLDQQLAQRQRVLLAQRLPPELRVRPDAPARDQDEALGADQRVVYVVPPGVLRVGQAAAELDLSGKAARRRKVWDEQPALLPRAGRRTACKSTSAHTSAGATRPRSGALLAHSRP